MITRHEVVIPVNEHHLQGLLAIPNNARGLVIFAHGSGSSRFSVRNQSVARALNSFSIATLLFDLLTDDENVVDIHESRYRFNISLLSHRLIAVTRWAEKHSECRGLPIAYFGASTGAAAAIVAASELHTISSVVSRGGRPDLAGISALHELASPILFIVGQDDSEVIELNKLASREVRVTHKLDIIDGASHLFEEPGTLEQVAEHAASWFLEHFALSKTSL